MRNRVVIALAVVAVLGAVARAQNSLQQTIHQVGYSLGLLRGLEEKDFIIASQFDATGTMLVGTRMVKVPRYRAQIRWDTPGMRVDYDLGEGAQKQRKVEVFGGKFAWNEDKPGAGLTPTSGTATPSPDAYTERLIQMWLTPHGVAKAAGAAGEKAAKMSTVAGKPTLTFPLPAPLESITMTATLDATTGRPERAEVRTPAGVMEVAYSLYKDFDNSDVPYPTRIVAKRDGKVIADMTVTNGAGYNPYVVFPIPKNVSAGQPGRVGG